MFCRNDDIHIPWNQVELESNFERFIHPLEVMIIALHYANHLLIQHSIKVLERHDMSSAFFVNTCYYNPIWQNSDHWWIMVGNLNRIIGMLQFEIRYEKSVNDNTPTPCKRPGFPLAKFLNKKKMDPSQIFAQGT